MVDALNRLGYDSFFGLAVSREKNKEADALIYTNCDSGEGTELCATFDAAEGGES